MWHHICILRGKNSGSLLFYKDGLLKEYDLKFRRGYTIKEGGTLVLGQEQDSVGGRFQAHQSFQGMLSSVNLWDYMLLPKDIPAMSASCLNGNDGNIYKWLDFIREGGARLVQPSPCEPLGKGTIIYHYNYHYYCYYYYYYYYKMVL